MASSCSGRKCFHSVSRMGPSTPRPPASPIRGYYPTAVDPGAKWSVAAVLVALLPTVVGLVVCLAAMLALRRKRLRGLVARREVTGDDGGARKPGQDELAQEGKWSAGPAAVELVVMAGETKPSHLATPTIQCPPFTLPAEAEDQ